VIIGGTATKRTIHTGRDYFEHIEGHVTTGASSQDDQQDEQPGQGQQEPEHSEHKSA
jgi:hypothetical protein